MSTPSNALQAAVFTRLKSFSALTTLVADRIYDFVPEDASPPFVVIGDDTAIDWSTKTNNGWEVTVTIHCWDFQKAGRKSVKAILSAIYDALHRQDVPITGFKLVEMQSEFETTIQDTSVEGDNDHYYHGIARYRALIETL